ncbi:secreted RxLR effector protein 161-like [Arachis stenosperma]|uniref:secreted RxLR effector protein 161-like n=1 Tax=Arachis stenosperma TaxID=217475 RepID=UPI0025ABE60E|nr:secreted RxLR effector protein 161-like [Arachis stenosperma]
MQDCRPCVTPLSSSIKFSAFGGSAFNNPKLYQSVVGSLQYLTVTRPKLAYCASKISQFVQNPLDEHWRLVKHILRYIRGTSTFGLLLQPTDITTVVAYSDSDWGGNPDDRKSTGGFCVLLGKNLVLWCSKKQGAVARSSTEAEYRAMVDLVAELLWIKNLMVELHTELPAPPSTYCDNLSAVLLAANPILYSKSKHFETDLHFVRDFVTERLIGVSHWWAKL